MYFHKTYDSSIFHALKLLAPQTLFNYSRLLVISLHFRYVSFFSVWFKFALNTRHLNGQHKKHIILLSFTEYCNFWEISQKLSSLVSGL